MAKRIILAIVLLFFVWSVLDFISHGLLLRSTFETTANLWRPMDQMNMPLMYLARLAFTAYFVLFHRFFCWTEITNVGHQIRNPLWYGNWHLMGFGSYSYMPIPLTLSWAWFFGAWIKAAAAGAIVGAKI